MEKKDWTLLVISSCGRLQPVHLQKALFLLGRNLKPSQLQAELFYNFEPYDYGPFCSEVYSDAEQLESDGLVHIDKPPGLSYRLYSPTEKGLQVAAELKKRLHHSVADYLEKLVQWACSMSFKKLVSVIYREYPDMKVNSIFQE